MATTYDFRTLSPLDFEDLTRDLLQAHWSVTLECFGPGADQGIDLRYLKGPDKIIVQAKHLPEGGFKGLKKAIRGERAKAIRLAPTRYVLVTSVSLSPARKDEILALMEGVPLVAHDILGREDLNNLLGQHGLIETRHFKLWLSSSNVLDRILRSGVYHRTEAEMDIIREMIPYFVQNASVTEAEAMLQETGALIIAGQPGVGKSTLARILLWLHAEQDWKIFVVDTLDQAFEVADSREKRLILLDDFLGQVRLSVDHVRGVDARLPPLLKRVSVHENLRFILTTRDYILAQARKLSDRLRPNQTSAREYVLNVGRYTRSVRARILYNHLYFSHLTPDQRDAVLEDDFFLQIIDHKNFNPRIIDEITKPQYLALTDASIRDTITRVLDNPQILWETPYRDHIDVNGRHLMLALYLRGRDTPLSSLKSFYVRMSKALGNELHAAEIEENFRATFKALDGSVMSLVADKVMFTNPGVADYLASVVRSDGIVPLLIPAMQVYGEVRELWATWIMSNPSGAERERLAPAWIDAVKRMHDQGLADRYAYVELVLDLYSELSSEALDPLVDKAIAAFEKREMGYDEVSHACSLLETSYSTWLPTELEDRLRNVATRASAKLLHEHSYAMNIEEIESLSEALHGYGNDADLAGTSTYAAMRSIEQDIREHIRDLETVDELDEFENNLIKLMKSYEFPTDSVTASIEYQRQRYYEEGRVSSPGSYSSHIPFGAQEDMSDTEIRSMFGALKAG